MTVGRMKGLEGPASVAGFLKGIWRENLQAEFIVLICLSTNRFHGQLRRLCNKNPDNVPDYKRSCQHVPWSWPVMQCSWRRTRIQCHLGSP